MKHAKHRIRREKPADDGGHPPLTQAEDRTLAALSADFDRRYAVMQSPGAAAAMQQAFDTPAAQLGAFAAASLQSPAR